MTRPGEEPGTRSLRGMVQITLVISGIVLVVSFIAGAWSYLSMVAARERLVDRVDPALTSAMRLRAATGDQQSGTRGFSFTGDPDFIGPWITGKAEADQAFEEMRELLEHPEVLAQLDEVERELVEWQTDWGEPSVEAARAGERTSREEYAIGRVQFNEVRTELDEVVDLLTERRAEARQELNDASNRLVTALVLVLATLGFLIVAVGVGLRRMVLRPIEQVVDDAGRIAMGELDHSPARSSTTELAELGRSLDHVRAALVAQLREAEEREADLARSNAELEQFAYVASHDLQEPLRKVASFCQLLEQRYKGQLDERADQYIEFAVDGAKRMQALINDLLAFSRVGRMSGDLKPVDLGEAAGAAVDALGRALAEADGRVEIGELPTVLGEQPLLTAVFQNLIANAIKFRSDAPPDVRIDAAAGDGEWTITCSDNGIGIEPEYAERVFVIFQRLHAKDRYGGTGIGLAMRRKIVEYHGGAIWLEETAGPGTTFRFTLPMTEEDR